MSNNVGAVKIVGGEGSSAHNTDGGDGGDILLLGGEAKGEGLDDNGGSIKIQGAVSFAGHGGSLELISGQSTEASSGAIKISTAPSGNKDGASGSLTLNTGKSTHGESGPIVINTGDAVGGPAGSVIIEVGDTVSRNIHSEVLHLCFCFWLCLSSSLFSHIMYSCHTFYLYLSLQLPKQRETDDIGSNIEFKTGYNPNTSSGVFRVQTADAGLKGDSGEISLRTGQAIKGNSGSVLFETGSTKTGQGGECWSVYKIQSHEV